MIATPDFTFIHLHKTGGQFVNRLLLRYLPGAERLGYHLPRSETPAALRQLPALGFVRNPWDWYVSWYAFNAANPTRNPIFRGVTDDGRLDFKASITNMLRLGTNGHTAIRQRIIAALPTTRENNLGSGITQADFARFDDPDFGYLSWLWRYMFFLDGSPAGVHVGRMERLRDELPGLLTTCGVTLSPEMLRAIREEPAVNASSRRDYRPYYDAELREQVARRDRAIVERYGYSF